MIEVVKVKLRDSGKIVYYNPRGLTFAMGDGVIIESDRGVDYGVVISEVERLETLKTKDPLKAVIRKADEKDQNKIETNKTRAREAIKTCQVKVAEHKLPMKLVDAEYSFDLSKLIFYFTAEGRVDFRELVKELAAIFKVRIELRQIGVRDEAKMFGGLAHCGRQLCCSTFLNDFEPVTIKMAKQQNLSLNPTKISGLCGRLMCCLSYEEQSYRYYSKGLPHAGDKVRRKDGKEGKIIDVNILQRKVLAIFEDGQVWIELGNCECQGKGECPVHSQYQMKGRGKGKKPQDGQKQSHDNNQKDDKKPRDDKKRPDGKRPFDGKRHQNGKKPFGGKSQHNGNKSQHERAHNNKKDTQNGNTSHGQEK